MLLTTEQVKQAKLFAESLAGNQRAQVTFAEGFTTSDVPIELTPTFNAILRKTYDAVPDIASGISVTEQTPDFDSPTWYSFAWGDKDVDPNYGGEKFMSGSLARIPEYAEYPTIRLGAESVSLSTVKGGIRVELSWETIIRTRKYNLVQKIFAEFGRRSARYRNFEATIPYFNQDGLNTANFNLANGNVTADNWELNRENVLSALEIIRNQKDPKGNTISAPTSYKLVVGRGLASVAQGIVDIDRIDVEVSVTDPVSNDVTVTKFSQPNILKGQVEVFVNPYMDELNPTEASTTWFLIPNGSWSGEPNVVLWVLEGYPDPYVDVRKTAVNESYAFSNDTYETKVRYALAGSWLFSQGTFGSTGKG